MKPSVISGVAILVVSGLFGYQRVYVSSRQELSRLREQLREQQQAQELRVQLARSLQELERFQQQLPPEPETEWLIREVGRLAQKAGVQLASITPQNPTKLDAFTRVAVTLQFQASYHQLGEFVSAIENATSFLRVDQLEVSGGQQRTTPILLTVSTVYVPEDSS